MRAGFVVLVLEVEREVWRWRGIWERWVGSRSSWICG